MANTSAIFVEVVVPEFKTEAFMALLELSDWFTRLSFPLWSAAPGKSSWR
jgi:hypothetical protein